MKEDWHGCASPCGQTKVIITAITFAGMDYPSIQLKLGILRPEFTHSGLLTVLQKT